MLRTGISVSFWCGSGSYLLLWCGSGFYHSLFSRFGSPNAPKWPSYASLWCGSRSSFPLLCGSGSAALQQNPETDPELQIQGLSVVGSIIKDTDRKKLRFHGWMKNLKVANKWVGSFLQPGNLAFVWPSNQTRSTRLLVSPGQVTTLIQPQVTTYVTDNQE